MGSMCSQEEPLTSNVTYRNIDDPTQSPDIDEKPSLTRRYTIQGIDTEESVASYDAGAAIDVFAHDGMKKIMSGPNPPESYLKIIRQLKLDIYFWSNVAYICKSDGSLNEKQKQFIRNRAQKLQMTNDKLQEIYIGKNYFVEMVENLEKYWAKVDPNLSKDELKRKLESYCEFFLIYAFLAATQNGLGDTEYQTMKHIAKEYLPLKNPEKSVKECVNIIKLEQQLAIAVQTKLYQE